jgi:hypothetical protein
MVEVPSETSAGELFEKYEPAIVTLGLLCPTCVAWELWASWHTKVTKSLKVSWPFSWYFVGLCEPLSS